LVPNDSRPHLRIDVARLDPSIDSNSFRSNKQLYDHMDLYCPTVGHELGHAIGLPHIKDLLGDPRCIADARNGIYPNRCYGETEAEKHNIMGGGTDMTLINAKPWVDRIEEHFPKSSWVATLDTTLPPRRLPIGAAIGGKPDRF
jgi:hypothetical protein